MLILGLDLARNTGWCLGEAGFTPESGSWELGKAGGDVHLQPPALARHLTRITEGRRPALIAVEDYMDPAAQRNSLAITTQLLAHGGLDAWAGVSRIRVSRVAASAARTIVCGRASAPRPAGRRLTKDQQRMATKRMVRDTMVLLGLVPPGTSDFDRTDAVCVWRWAEAMHSGARQSLVLTP